MTTTYLHIACAFSDLARETALEGDLESAAIYRHVADVAIALRAAAA